MKDMTAAKRYAKSMLILSDQADITEQVEAELLSLKAAYLADPTFRQFMTHPRIPRRAKTQALARIYKGKVHPYVLAFLDLLVRRQRFELVPAIADSFDEMADASRGVVRVKVRTFRPLAEPQRKRLESQIGRIVGGRKLDMQVDVDASLLGGLWVKIGDTLIDGTVATKLKTIRERLFDLRLA